MPYRIRQSMLLLLLLCSPMIRLGAQDGTTGALRGTVRTISGVPIADAKIELRSIADEVFLTMNTAEDGDYFFPQLVPGEYRVRVISYGFADVSIASIAIALGTTTRLDLHLRLTAATTVTVNTEALGEFDLLMDSGPANSTIRPDEMQSLPLDGRQSTDFALLTPLLNADDSAGAELSARGTLTSQNSYLLDGIDSTQSFSGVPRGGTRAALRIPYAAVREFRVSAAEYPTTLGHTAGAVIATVTRRGEQAFHGSAFMQARDNLFGAINPFSYVTRYNNGAPTTTFVQPKDLRLQWGATAGGPVSFLRPLRQRLFYFLAYEQQRRSYPALSSPLSPSFYNLTAVQTALLQNRGVTPAQVADTLRYLDSLTGTLPRRADGHTFFPRLDWHPQDKHQLTLEWNRAHNISPHGVRTQPVVHRAVTSFGTDVTHADDVIVRWTAFRSATFGNSLTFAYAREIRSQQPEQPLPQEPHTGSNGFSPQVNIGGELILGKPASLGRRRFPDERRWQIVDTLHWSGPASLLQTGFSASFVGEHIDSLQNEEGSYTYSNASFSTPGNGRAGALVDFITDSVFSAQSYPNGGCPSIFNTTHFFCFNSYTQSFGSSVTDFHTTDWAAFAHFQWRPAQNLTLDAGLRYELTTLPAAQHPNASLDTLFGSSARTSSLPSDTNNLAPRIGLAWSPDKSHRTVIHLGYGIYFGRIAGATLRSALANTAQPQSTVSIRLTPRTIVDATCASAGTNFGYPATYACTPNAAAARTTSAVLFDRRFQLPMVQQMQFAVERQLGPMTFSAAYIGASSRQLPNSADINIAPSTSTATFRIVRPNNGGPPGVRDGDIFVVPLYTQRISNDFGPVTAILSNASASYHALVLSVLRPLRNGVQMRVAWTYAKMLDYGQRNGETTLEQDGQFDPFNVRYDRAISTLDHRHKILASGIWQPLVHRQHIVNALLNDWSFAPIFSATSGRPYSYLISGGSSLNGGRESINGSGGARYLASVGRNTLRLPWVESFDLRFDRRVRLREHVNARFYAEGFNVLNHVNYTGLQQRAFLVGAATAGVTPLVYQDAATLASEGLNAQPFGTFTASDSDLARERRLQFGVHVEW